MSSRPDIGVWELPERFVRRAQGITLTRVSFHGMTPQALPAPGPLPPARGAGLGAQERANVEGDERSAAAGVSRRPAA